VSRHGPGYLKPYRRARSSAYKVARGMGNLQPWLELSPRKIVRRYVYRRIGQGIVAPLYGGRGLIGRMLRGLFGG